MEMKLLAFVDDMTIFFTVEETGNFGENDRLLWSQLKISRLSCDYRLSGPKYRGSGVNLEE